jgi:ribosome maturation factor RimP
MLKIRISGNVAGRRNFTGILKDVRTEPEGAAQETTVVVQVGSEEFRIPFRQIERASLVVQD